MERARTQGRKTIEATGHLEALSSHDGLFVDVLRNMGASPEAVQENVGHRCKNANRKKNRTERSLSFRLI